MSSPVKKCIARLLFILKSLYDAIIGSSNIVTTSILKLAMCLVRVTYDKLPENSLPEILRTPLDSLVLQVELLACIIY